VGHEADAAVHRLGEKFDALRLELGPGRFDVIDVEGDRVGVGRELAADRGCIEELQGEVAGLDLAGGDFAVVNRVLEAEGLAVELHCGRVVDDEDGGEIDAGDGDGRGFLLTELALRRIRLRRSAPAGLPGDLAKRSRLKEQVLNPGDRAALQALVPLAGALGVGTIFALFFGARRKAGLAVFELFAIVAVLTAAGSTAYLSVAFLHQNTAISSHDLTQTATPLLVAAVLLVFVSVFARLPGSPMRALMILPLAVTGVVVAAVLASSSWSANPEEASLLALAILAVGALLGVCAWGADRLDIGWDRREERKRLAGLYSSGYLPEEKPLRFAVPRGKDEGTETIACWMRKGRSYLDLPMGWHLRAIAHRLWRAQAVGEARPPVGSVILVRTQIRVRFPVLRRRARVCFHLLEPARGGESRPVELEANEDGLFDVTELGIV
jgi:hypothetical protein